MAENENTTPEAAPQEEAPQFAVQRIYLKDASLEMPNAPEIFLAPEAPQVDIQLDVSEHGLAQPDLTKSLFVQLSQPRPKSITKTEPFSWLSANRPVFSS